MNASFHPDAQAELNHAIGYYEASQPGLGYQFAIEVLWQLSGSRRTQPYGH